MLDHTQTASGPRRRSTKGLTLAVLTVLLPGAAAAEDDPFRRGIDPVSTKLSATLDGLLTSEGARTSPAGSLQVELGADYNSGLMSLRVGDEKIGNLIRQRLDLHLLAAYAITDWAEVAADVPFTVHQTHGFDGLEVATGLKERAPAALGLGDVRLLGKFRLLREEEHFVTVGAALELRVPTGEDGSFLGERSVLLYPRAVVERTFLERVRVAFDAGYRYRALPGRFLNLYVGDELAFALAGSVRLPEIFDRRWTATAELLVSTPARAPFAADNDALKTPAELLVGLGVQLYQGFWLNLGGGLGLAGESGYGHEELRLFATVGYRRLWRDRDGDGIADDEDRCPDKPEDLDRFQDSDGCPDPDNDGDGTPDQLDACPQDAGPKKLSGCPDGDGDGVPDRQDACPKQPGPVDYDGCPDADGDEVPDHEDKCAKAAGPATNDGCPMERPYVLFEKGRLVLRGAVHFDSGKASIKQQSLAVLDDLAAGLAAHPEIKHLRIEGHTDSIGGQNLNQDLSQRRAQAVVDYLVSRGIDAGRLSALGFGLDRPIATNATPLGRAKNRRVECNIMDQ